MNGSAEMEKEDEFLDIDPALREVAKEYGRSMFALVLNAGMGGEAARILGEVLQRQHSRHGVQALRHLVSVFNQVSNAYVIRQGWTQEDLAACEQAIKLAFAGKVAIEESKIILAH